MKRVLALNENGELTYCTAPPDKRGCGRCNHVDHQMENETYDDFVSRISSHIAVDKEETIESQEKYIEEIVSLYNVSFNNNPDWEQRIKSMQNHFVIGKGDSYEEANMESLIQEKILNENGDPVIKLTAKMKFRDRVYDVDFGEVPEVQKDGCIVMNGSRFRVLPVLSQFKSGLIMSRDKIIVKKEDGNIAMVMEPGNDKVKIKGREIDIEEVSNYLNGLPCKLTRNEKLELDNIDPIVYERFPEFKTDIYGVLNSHEPDEPNDISYRKVITYEDQVANIIAMQTRRMGNTFRSNLAKRVGVEEDEKIKELDEKYPLFYQKNITENIRTDLMSRSNVQIADNLNALSALSQSHKISLTGPGGYNKEKAPMQLRQVHKSHKNVIDSLDISSGGNIGLTISLDAGDVDERGYIKSRTKPKMAVSDFIPYKYHNDINRACMAVAHMKQAVSVVGGEDPKPIGDSSDKAWKHISGAKLGVVAKTVYLPVAGTDEDSVLISESMSKKMKTIQTNTYKLDTKKKMSKNIGDEVKSGEYVDGVKIKYNGVIKSAINGELVVESTFEMKKGDKIAGRHGNKGTIGGIIPDKDMPKIENNGKFEPAEIIISPLSVAGRMNLGQVFETNDGDFDKVTKTKLPNGHVVDSTGGTQFIMRLNHIAEKKRQQYDSEIDSKREQKGLRMGEMESILLTSTEERREVLHYLRNQEQSDTENKLNNLMKSIGAEIK